MHSLSEVIYLAAFAGFSFWTASFMSVVLIGIFRKGSDPLPTVSRLIGIYFSRALALIVIFAGMVWLLVRLTDFPIYLFNDVSYVRISLLAIFSGITSSIISIVFPNLFLQGLPSKDL